MSREEMIRSREIHNPEGKVIGYLVPLSEPDRDRIACLTAEAKALREEVGSLQGALARAHQSMADLHARIEGLLKERGQWETERDEYLRTAYFMYNEETLFTEKDRLSCLESTITFDQVFELLGIPPDPEADTAILTGS